MTNIFFGFFRLRMSAWLQKLLILLHRLSSISPILGLYFALGLYGPAASVFVLLYRDRVSGMGLLHQLLLDR